MSSSKAITERPDERALPGGWRPGDEVAPSVLREDEPTFARVLGVVGAFLAIFGGLVLSLNLSDRLGGRISPAWAAFFLSLGLVSLLFHAAFDRDLQIRRVYMAFGYLALVLGAFLCLIPSPNNVGDQFRFGFPCMGLALLFLLAFLRNETDPAVRNTTEMVLGAAGALMAVIGLFGGSLRASFLLPYGLLLAVLGLFYLTAFVSTRGTSNDLAYRAGLAIGAVGVLVFLVAFVRSVLPIWFSSIHWDAKYFMPQGLLLMAVGLLYALAAVGLCSEHTLVVMTRRELASFFYSPMAYFVLLGFGIASWVSFLFFVDSLLPGPRQRAPLEPIVTGYLFSLLPVITNVFVVPILTMRLLSEERRSGTFEVLMTAPVSEVEVVVSKFLAALVMYLIMWAPFGLYLLALPLGGAEAFDYKPLLSYLVGLVVVGAAFVSMGLFFSSLTRNQIVSGVLTFAGMLTLTALYLAVHWMELGPNWQTVLTHMSYLDVWQTTTEGRLIPRTLLFFGSTTVWWLFVTVKVLEARKWL